MKYVTDKKQGPDKKDRRRRISVWIGIIFLIVSCFLCSCKKEEAENLRILSEKNTENTKEGTGKQTMLKEELEVPDKLEKELQSKDGKNTVEVNADIVVPDVSAIPERTIYPRSHTQEEADEIIKNIFPDGKLYEPEYRDTEEEQKEKGFQKELSNLFEENQMDTFEYFTKDDETKEGRITSQTGGQNIAYNNKIYTLTIHDYDRLTKEASKDYAMQYGSSVQLLREDFIYDSLGVYLEDGLSREEVEMEKQYPLPAISEEEALRLAEEGMEKCHLYDYQLFSTAYAIRKNGKNGKKQTAYDFTFVKKADGVSIFNLNEIAQMEQPEFEEGGLLHWSPEGVEMKVDEDGIVDLYGGSDGEYSDGEGNGKLLAFAEIEKIMETALLKADEEYSSLEQKKEICHVELGYVRVWKSKKVKEAKLEGTLKPAWVFYGKYKAETDDKNVIGEYGDRNLQLVIDASTGEVMAKQNVNEVMDEMEGYGTSVSIVID